MNKKKYCRELRDAIFNNIKNDINELENNLNKVGNPDLQKEDYINIDRIITRLTEIRRIYNSD